MSWVSVLGLSQWSCLSSLWQSNPTLYLWWVLCERELPAFPQQEKSSQGFGIGSWVQNVSCLFSRGRGVFFDSFLVSSFPPSGAQGFCSTGENALRLSCSGVALSSSSALSGSPPCPPVLPVSNQRRFMIKSLEVDGMPLMFVASYVQWPHTSPSHFWKFIKILAEPFLPMSTVCDISP